MDVRDKARLELFSCLYVTDEAELVLVEDHADSVRLGGDLLGQVSRTLGRDERFSETSLYITADNICYITSHYFSRINGWEIFDTFYIRTYMKY